MKTTSNWFRQWLIAAIAGGLALGGVGAVQAATLTHNAWGSNYSVNCTGYDALQFNATRNPGQGGPPFAGNTLLMLSDVTYWYPLYPCYESTTWTSNGTGRKAAKVSGAYMNPNPTSLDDLYLPIARFIKLRNLTIDNVDLDYDNIALWFYTSGAVTPAPDMSLTLNNGSITGLNPPTFDSRSRFNLSATGDSSIANWWTRIRVSSTTTLNVTGAGSKLTFFRVGNTSGAYMDALYFADTNNTALIDGATLKLDQSSITFGDPHPSNNQYSPMTFQNNATLDLDGPDTKLESGKVSFINSNLKLGLGRTRLIVDDRLTFNGASADIAGTATVTTQALDILGNNTIALPKEYSSTDYTMMAGIVVMEPDSSLTLNGQGSLASDFQLRWSFAPSGHYGQIVINDRASLVNDRGTFIIIPGAPITINRTSVDVYGALRVKNGGVIELRGASTYFANFNNQGELSAYANGEIIVPAGTYNVLGGSQGYISVGDDGVLTIGNFGTTLGAAAVLNTDNRVELENFSTLQLTIDPTARSSSQLRTSSEITIPDFAKLNLALVNDQVLPVGTKFVLIDYGSLVGSWPGPDYFNGYRNGRSFVLGLNRYQINYHDTDPGYAGAVTLTVVPLVPPTASLSPNPQTISGTVGASLTPSATMVPSNFGGTVTYSINPALPSGLKFDLVNGVISGTPSQALAATAFTIRGVGSTSGDANATVNLTIAKANQSITFGPAPAPTYAPGGVFLVSASASSSLPVTYSSLTPLVCTAGSSSVNIVSAGSCTIAANQVGDANYNAAAQVTQTIIIAKAQPAPLTLVANPADIVVGGTSTLSTSGGGTGAISFIVTSGSCTVSGNSLTSAVSGGCTVEARQLADANYEAGKSNPVAITVGIAPQASLQLAASPSSLSVNGSSTLSTVGGSGTGTVTFTVTGPCTVAGNTLTGTSEGQCQATATKAGDGNYSAATSNPVTVTVNRLAAPTLVLAANPTTVGFGGSSTLSTTGGISGGAVTYTVSGPCYVSGNIVTGTSTGNCQVIASQAQTTIYNAVTSNTVNVTVRARTTTFIYPPATAAIGLPFVLTPGLSGFTAPTFALFYGNLPAGLTLNSRTGVISGTPTGPVGIVDGVISAYENNAYDAALAVIDVQAAPPLTLTPAIQTASGTVGVALTQTAAMIASGFGGTVSYTISPSLPSGLSLNNATGAIFGVPGTALAATAFTIRGTGSVSGSATATVNLTVGAASQTISFGPAPTPTYAPGGTFVVSASASSGLPVAFSSLTPAVCTATGSTIHIQSAGTCTIAADQTGNASYSPAPQQTQAINIAKANPAVLVLAAAPTSITVGASSALTTTGGGGIGAISYALSGNGTCNIVGSTLTATATGTCTVVAMQAADPNYNQSQSNPVAISVGIAQQASLQLTANPTSLSVNGTSTLGTFGGSGTGAVSYTVTGPCTIVGNTLTANGQGQCQVTATKAGDSNYGAATSNPLTLAVNRLAAPALVLSASPTTVGFDGSSTLSTTGGISSGVVTYTVSGPCYVSGSILTGTSAGSCPVTASQAETTIYSAVTSNTVTVMVSERTTTFSYPRGTAAIGRPFVLTPSFSGFTAPTFALFYGNLPAGLTLNPQTGVISGTPTGPIGTVDGAISAYENNAYDAALAVIDVQTAPPVTLSPATQTASGTVGVALTQTAALIASGFGGAVSYTISPALPSGLSLNAATGAIFGVPGAALATSAFTIRGTGTASGSATATVNLSVAAASQTISFGPAPSPTYAPGGTFAVSASASSGLPVAFSSLTPTVCTATGSSIHIQSAGTCTIAADQAGNANYTPAPQAKQMIAIAKATAAPLVLSAAPTSITVGASSALTTTGGGGTGAVSYALSGTGTCTVAGNTLTGTATGTCTVVATQAGDPNYNALQSNPVAVSVGIAQQASLQLTASPSSLSVTGTSTLRTSGGSGTGAVTYTVTGPCTIAGNTLTANGQGQCQVTATKAGDSNYGAATSNPLTLIVSRLVAPTLVLSASPTKVGFGGSSTLSTTGGISGGAVTYGLTGPCYVSGNTLTGTSAGVCQVTASQAETAVYGAVTSNTVTVAVSERSTTFSYPRATAAIGLPFVLAPSLGGFTAPTFALFYGNLPAGLTLNPQTGVISGTPTGPVGTVDGVISVYENNAYDAALVVIDVQQVAPSLATPVPTLSEWSLLVLASMLVLLTGLQLRRAQRSGRNGGC